MGCCTGRNKHDDLADVRDEHKWDYIVWLLAFDLVAASFFLYFIFFSSVSPVVSTSLCRAVLCGCLVNRWLIHHGCVESTRLQIPILLDTFFLFHPLLFRPNIHRRVRSRHLHSR